MNKHLLSPTVSFCLGTPEKGTSTDSSHHGQTKAALGSRGLHAISQMCDLRLIQAERLPRI